MTPELLLSPRELFIAASYLVAAACFILCLQDLSSPKNARRGILLGEIGMLAAIIGTLLHHEIITYAWIIPGLVIGSIIGAAMAIWIPMTKMPERIALSHAFGGLAAALVGIAEYYRHGGQIESRLVMGALGFEVLLGSLTFTGSLMAFGKLQGLVPGRPITYRGQNVVNIGAMALGLVLLVAVVINPALDIAFYAMGVIGFITGIMGVLPIGGADMPVVVSLLNSYAGLAAAATGFAIGNNVLIIAGALDGTSGFLLSMKMSKAMNRSFANVLFGAFGTDTHALEAGGQPDVGRSYNTASIEEAIDLLHTARQVIIVPGYGMAVSQAQHTVRELASELESNGTTVKYAIHPVAGRMPGHMNVLLAEADVPYDQLFDLDDINDEFAQTDVVLVVGANDVVNPAAKNNPGSPIFGMPVFNVEKARTVLVLKRSMNPGFSGIENELFFQANTLMVLGDAKKTLSRMTGGMRAALAA